MPNGLLLLQADHDLEAAHRALGGALSSIQRLAA